MRRPFKNWNKPAPMWLQQLMGAILILQGLKTYVVNGLPFVDDPVLIGNIAKVYDWALALPGVVISLWALFTKRKSLNDIAEDESE